MRLAHLTWVLSEAGGGIPAIVLSLAGAQRKAGHIVNAFGVEDPTSNTEIRGAECHRSVGPLALGLAPGLKNGIRRSNPAILHLHGLFTWSSRVASTWGAATSRPVVVAPHGMLEPWALANSRWKKVLFRWFVEDRNLKRAACVHVGSLSEAENVRRLGLQRPIAVIPNGVEMSEGAGLVSPQEILRVLPKVRGRRVLLFMSRIHPKKGLLPLLEAWATLRREGCLSDWILVIAGPDQLGHRAEVEARVRALELESFVELAGPVYGPTKAAVLAGANAFVLPSFSEGFAMAVLEAMASGLPVLITRQCNLDVEAFGGGLLCEPTAASLANRLLDLLSFSDEERKSLGARGRAEVELKYTWPRVAEQLDEVYTWLSGGGTPPSTVIQP